jgi:hypothetical protein
MAHQAATSRPVARATIASNVGCGQIRDATDVNSASHNHAELEGEDGQENCDGIGSHHLGERQLPSGRKGDPEVHRIKRDGKQRKPDQGQDKLG